MEAFRRSRDELLENLPSRLTELKGQLVEGMEPFDAFDVIANLLFANLPLNPDTYRESAHAGLIAYVEYAALVLLERPGRLGTEDRDVPIGANEIQPWTELLREILTLSSISESRRVMGDLTADDPLAEVRAHVVRRELFLRNPVYDWQEEATLCALFNDERVRDGGTCCS